jgi:uncharacterized membrane protein
MESAHNKSDHNGSQQSAGAARRHRGIIARHIPRQPQIAAFAVVLVVASGLSWWLFRNRLALLAGFDVAAIVYLVWVWRALSSAQPKTIRSRTTRYETGRRTLLFLAALVFGVVLVAIAAELGHGSHRSPREMVLILFTLIIAWCFANMIFALEYMHRYYADEAASQKGLDFPGDSEPGFWEFVYFAYTIGMTFQTSDVALCTSDMRKLATLHALVSFIFNVGVVALTVNLLAGGGS